jgi:hypothetical protein
MQRLVKGALSMPRGLFLRDPSAVAGAAAKRAAACSAWRQLTFIPASTQLVGPGTVAGPATWLCAAGAVANHNRWWCQQRGGRSHQRCLSSASLPFGDVPVEELVKKADVAKVRAELEGLMPPPSPLLFSSLLLPALHCSPRHNLTPPCPFLNLLLPILRVTLSWISHVFGYPGMSVQKISTSDFCASCAKYGITGAEALNLLSAFHAAGKKHDLR